MKKLIIVGVGFAMALAANAASVNWTATGCGTEGNVGYFFDEATIASASVKSAILNSTFGSVAGEALGMTTVNAAGVLTKQGMGSYGNAGAESHNFYTVLFDAASASDAKNFILTDAVTVDFANSIGAKPALFANVTTTYGWNPTNVPEPTTGLLLLLGMAGLALKRKQA